MTGFRSTISIVLVLFSAFCFSSSTVIAESDISTNAPTPTLAQPSPDSVLSQFFTFLQSGQSSEAQNLFLIRNTDQQKFVGEYVNGGIAFFAKTDIRNLVIEVFKEGPFSICAIEQTMKASPGKFEVERGCLVLEGHHWKLLPQPGDFRAPINGLTPDEKASFNSLLKKFNTFKRGYKKD